MLSGVIWSGRKTPIPGSVEALEYLHSLGKKLLFVTNNSTYSRRDLISIFHSFGLLFVTIDDIFNSPFSTALYIKNFVASNHKHVFALGGSGLINELKLADIPVYSLNDSSTDVPRPEKVTSLLEIVRRYMLLLLVLILT